MRHKQHSYLHTKRQKEGLAHQVDELFLAHSKRCVSRLLCFLGGQLCTLLILCLAALRLVLLRLGAGLRLIGLLGGHGALAVRLRTESSTLPSTTTALLGLTRDLVGGVLGLARPQRWGLETQLCYVCSVKFACSRTQAIRLKYCKLYVSGHACR